MGQGKRQIRIRGIVIPIGWDAEGIAIKAAIFIANEEEYLIEENTNSKQLLSLIRQEVEVRGRVTEEAGQKVITVEDYQRIRRGQDTSKILQKEDAIHQWKALRREQKGSFKYHVSPRIGTKTEGGIPDIESKK